MSTKLERLVCIDALIRQAKYPSVQTLCQRFEVRPRTIYDDIHFLKNRLQAPLRHSHSHHGYFYSDPSWQLPAFIATEGQLLAFFLSVELAHRYLGTSFEDPLREAIQQLLSLLPNAVQISMSDLVKHYSVRAGATSSANPETLLALQTAIQHRHPIDMVYFTASRGEENQRVIHPYHLFNMNGEWYLIAYDLLRLRVLQFAVPRIRRWGVLTKETFDVDPTFSLQGYFRDSFQAEHGERLVKVVLLFDAYQARYIRERTWHDSQHLEEQSGGKIRMEFTTGALEEVQRWIMSYGSHVSVIEPAFLAEKILSECLKMIRSYQSPSPFLE